MISTSAPAAMWRKMGKRRVLPVGRGGGTSREAEEERMEIDKSLASILTGLGFEDLL